MRRTTSLGHGLTQLLLLSFGLLLGISGADAALQMARIAQLGQQLNTNFQCGDANHNGRCEIYGTTPYPDETLLVYEYQGHNQFQRQNCNALVSGGPREFGDGDKDSLMEVVGQPGNGATSIWEARALDSFPSDSVWGACPAPSSPGDNQARFIDLDQDGREELALQIENYGICLYENSGDNQYRLAAVLSDTPPFEGPGWDFGVGDMDNDGRMELVEGSDWDSPWLRVYKATGGDDQYVLAVRCSTETSEDYYVAVAHDMDHDGKPEFIAEGMLHGNLKLMIYEASDSATYSRVWDEMPANLYQGFMGNPISVGDVDGDGTEEFEVSGGGRIGLYKCNGPHSYQQVWLFDSAGTELRLFDVNRDGRAEVMFDGPQGSEIWEDTEGLGVAEFSKFSLESPVKVSPSVVRLGASLLFSGLPPDAAIEVLGLDGRLVSRASGVRQPTWTWNLRNQSGNLVPAGTYFAVIRSKGKTTSLKLCLVK